MFWASWLVWFAALMIFAAPVLESDNMSDHPERSGDIPYALGVATGIAIAMAVLSAIVACITLGLARLLS